MILMFIPSPLEIWSFLHLVLILGVYMLSILLLLPMGIATHLFLMPFLSCIIFSISVLLSNLLYGLSSFVLTAELFSYSFLPSISVCVQVSRLAEQI